LARRGYDTDWTNIPTVCGAVVYDFRGRSNAIYPDKELGRRALQAAQSGRFPLGARGAGRFVHAGKFFGGSYGERSGQGGAYAQIGPTRLAVFTVVNAVGQLVDRSGRLVCGNRDPKTGIRARIADELRDGSGPRKRQREPQASVENSANTTLTLVATNQALPYRELQRLAMQTHTSMARAIHPFHSEHDGDLLFAATTAEIQNPELEAGDLAAWASELAWNAVLAGVPGL
jgi:L-aminopeptidase/D-esterase-like protein